MVRSSSKTLVRRRRSRAPQLEALERRELLTPIPVTTLADAGSGSLRAAIERANLEPGPDTITFPAVAGTITLASALPELASEITLTGPGAANLTIARSTDPATPMFRILTIPEGASVSLSGMTLSGGRIAANGAGLANAGTATLTGVVLVGHAIYGPGSGAGLFNSGTMQLDGVTLAENIQTSPLFVQSPGGGGVGNTGTLSIRHSNIRDNAALSDGTDGSRGGGIANAGALTIVESLIQANRAYRAGGGIHNSGTLELRGSTIAGNYTGAIGGRYTYGGSGVGGGINNSGSLTIVESTIRENSARPESFIGQIGSSAGGGLANDGSLRLERSTLSDNYAGGRYGGGGADLDTSGMAVVTNSTVSNEPNTHFLSSLIANSGQLLILGSTIASRLNGPTVVSGAASSGKPYGLVIVTSIFSNSHPDGRSLVASVEAFHSIGHNLFSDRPEVQLATTDLTGADSRLGPLADNGGPTWTRELLPGSAALNAGQAVSALATDQRGVARPQGLRPDIGAFEVVLVAPRVIGLERFGYHWRPTTLVVAFDDAMDPVRATNVANYALVQLGPGGRQRSIDLTAAEVSEATRSVTLRPAHRLSLQGRYQLTVRGRGPDGLASRDGQLLDGAGTGQAGTDFVQTFGREALHLPARPGLAGSNRLFRVRGSGLRGAAGR